MPVLNLGINARDAIIGDGKIIISLSENAPCSDQIKEANFVVRHGEHICIAVHDTGSGVDESIREKIFEPFFTTKPKGKGTGLGLAGVQDCIRVHQGYIELESEIGKGSTFKLFFPRKIVPVISGDTKIDFPIAKITAETISTVIVIDDDDGVLELLKESLSDLGYPVLTFNKGADALKWFEHNRERNVLVILDLMMPSMSGRQCLSRLKGIRDDILVIVMTAYTEDTEYFAIQKMGIHGILNKPFELEAVHKAVLTLAFEYKETINRQ